MNVVPARPATSPVAVLLCVHCGANPEHFREALQSMREQTYVPLRLFIFADGAISDAHERVLADLVDESVGDVVLRSARSVGLPAGLNALIDRSLQAQDIEFFARMDADDLSLPDRISHQVDFLRDHPEVDLAGTWCVEFTEPGVPLFHKQLPSGESEVLDFTVCRSPLAHPTVMFRRRVFEAGHRYDERLLQAQDYEFWTRLVRAGGRISNVPEYLLWYRMAPGFFKRRSGLTRAINEFRERLRFALAMGLLTPMRLAKLAALFLSRIAPERVKHFLYMRMR